MVPQDLTGQQWIRKIQRACCRSAICPRRTVYLPFPVCSPDAQASRCDTATSETTATLCRPDSTNQRAALVGPQIRTAFCLRFFFSWQYFCWLQLTLWRDTSCPIIIILSGPFETNNKRRLLPNYSMMQRNEILFWRQSIAKMITIHIILPFNNHIACDGSPASILLYWLHRCGTYGTYFYNRRRFTSIHRTAWFTEHIRRAILE